MCPAWQRAPLGKWATITYSGGVSGPTTRSSTGA